MPDKGLVEKLNYEDADKVVRELTGGQGLDVVDSCIVINIVIHFI